MVHAFESWKPNGGKHVTFSDFEQMVKFANPEMTSTRRISKIFMLVTQAQRAACTNVSSINVPDGVSFGGEFRGWGRANGVGILDSSHIV